MVGIRTKRGQFWGWPSMMSRWHLSSWGWPYKFTCNQIIIWDFETFCELAQDNWQRRCFRPFLKSAIHYIDAITSSELTQSWSNFNFMGPNKGNEWLCSFDPQIRAYINLSSLIFLCFVVSFSSVFKSTSREPHILRNLIKYNIKN